MPWDFNNAAPQGGDGGGEDRAERGPSLDAIGDALAGLAERWVPELFPAGRIADGKLRLGDITGRAPRKSGSCVIELTGDKAGSWHDFGTGKGGGNISTIGEAFKLSGRELIARCIEIIEQYGGAGYLDRPRPKIMSAGEYEDRKRRRAETIEREARFIWDHAQPYLGTLGEAYLRARGISMLPPDGDLRFDPTCTTDRNAGRSEPALIALFRNPDRTPTGGIHRIYLRPDGSWHTGDGAKKMLGTPGLVMLALPEWADGNLGMGEGIETTAAAMELFKVPGWAAASDGGMKRFANWLRDNWRPDSDHCIRRLYIWADAGAAGMTAAGILYAAALEIGLPAAIYLPQGGDDFADDLRRGLAVPLASAAPAQPQGRQELLPPPPAAAPTQIDPVALAGSLNRNSTIPEICHVVEAIARAGLDPITEDKAIAAIAYATKAGKPALQKALKQARNSKAPTLDDMPGSVDWSTDPRIVCFDSGEPKPVLVNVALVLSEDAAWRDALALNEFTGMIWIRKNLPYEENPGHPCDRPWTDMDELKTTRWIQATAGIHAPPIVIFQAIQTVADGLKFHPVRDYLDTLVWDGTPRIDRWLTYYLGVDDSIFARAVGARFLIAAVARVMKPGCKMDTALILEGPQGLKKSTALKILGDPWFSDEIAEIGSKDAAMQMRGIWILEFAELDKVKNAEVSALKAFMTRTKDRFRPPYGRQVVESKRQNVFAGSVNDNEYLRDSTGGRRFWPVLCRGIDTDSLRADRNQLWAEAVARYHNGERWWIDPEETELNDAANAEQEARFIVDPWEPDISAFLESRPMVMSVTTNEILAGALDIRDRTRWGRAEQSRVGVILRRLGWLPRRVRDGVKAGPRRYFRPEDVT